MSLHDSQKFTKLMTISLVQDMITFLNMLRSRNGILINLSPEATILGYPNTEYNKLKIIFGVYAQVYICTTNSTKEMSVGAITLRPPNERGGYYFMSLTTGKQLHAFICTELPINHKLIQRVNELTNK